jgi:hypothetical protein
MYHDQGHGPIKVLGLEAGVNITVGLPYIRTSVDHGTAFDIAGTAKADERSLGEALKDAIELAPKPSATRNYLLRSESDFRATIGCVNPAIARSARSDVNLYHTDDIMKYSYRAKSVPVAEQNAVDAAVPRSHRGSCDGNAFPLPSV